ncbi:MAG TPA: site-specific DNA-methyltransferase [Ignavibacteria bacterium]|nr:site-specific DNA-methyltransferase [Ignavibacteria bacterium]
MLDNYLNPAKPRYSDKIIQGDCLELFKRIPDNSIDMTFADPPFNLKKNYKSYKDSLEFQEYLNWCHQWISEMVRVTKPTGTIFLHNIPKWLTYYASFLNEIAFFKHWISWDASTSPMGKSLQPAHYGILFYGKEQKGTKINELRCQHKRDRKQGYLIKDYGGKKDKLHPFGPLISDVWKDIHRIKHNKNRDAHPCQLPIHLLDRLILLSTDENDIVLDPFIGTGTTAISAKRLGRNYIGFELDPFYVNIAKEKLLKTESNFKLGKSWVSFYLNEVITLRNKDWNSLKKYFLIPKPIRSIDNHKTILIDKKLIPINGNGKYIKKEDNKIDKFNFNIENTKRKKVQIRNLAINNKELV